MNDKKMLILIIIFVFVFEYKFIYMPGRKKLETVNKIVSQKQSDMELLEKLCSEYELTKKNEEDTLLKTADSDFSLFSFLGKIIEKQNLEKNISSIKPLPIIEKESFLIEKIRISVDNVTLQQIYDFLYSIETSRNAIYVPEYRMKRNKEKEFLLGVEMELLSIRAVDKQ
ncbi:hypothetical protein M0P98_07980 [bacterium]|nr:hypothetical protein [bacterium]